MAVLVYSVFLSLCLTDKSWRKGLCLHIFPGGTDRDCRHVSHFSWRFLWCEWCYHCDWTSYGEVGVCSPAVESHMCVYKLWSGFIFTVAEVHQYLGWTSCQFVILNGLFLCLCWSLRWNHWMSSLPFSRNLTLVCLYVFLTCRRYQPSSRSDAGESWWVVLTRQKHFWLVDWDTRGPAPFVDLSLQSTQNCRSIFDQYKLLAHGCLHLKACTTLSKWNLLCLVLRSVEWMKGSPSCHLTY